MADTRAISTGKHQNNKSLLSKLKTEDGATPSPKKVRCILAECQYVDNFELDEHGKKAISTAASEGFKCLLFVSVKEQADYDSWYEKNKLFLMQYKHTVEMQSNLECYESQQFLTVLHAMKAFYAKNPNLEKEFEARVLDEAKTYVARQLIKEEKKKIGEPKYPDVASRKEALWEKASEELKTRSKAHVFNEAIAVVTWGVYPDNLITVAISGHFTSAMRIAVKHASDHADEMGIGFKKNLFHIEMLGKRSDLPRIFESAGPTEDKRISPEAKELAALYIKELPTHQALDFIFAFNARITGYVPVATPSNSDSEEEQLSSSPLSSSPPRVRTTSISGPAMYYKPAESPRLKPPVEIKAKPHDEVVTSSLPGYRKAANDGSSDS